MRARPARRELGRALPVQSLGYFALDPDSTADYQVWNRGVTLRDTWAKVAKK